MKPSEDFSPRVEKLAPRFRAYVRGLEAEIGRLKAQLGDGPHELVSPFGGEPRRLPDGEYRLNNKNKQWASLKLEPDGIGFRLYGSNSMIVAFSSTNMARVTVGDVVTDLAYHGIPLSEYSKKQLKERYK